MPGAAFHLRENQGALALHSGRHPHYGAVQIDWHSADLCRRIAAGRRQPLARALDLSNVGSRPPHIVDATAGLGRDAWVLAALGAHVTLLERTPAVAALLDNALQRARSDAANPTTQAIAGRITLHRADARDWLAAAAPGACDAIYLDPMYPEDGKSALPTKEMQLLRELTGGDPDAGGLLDAACRVAHRVAVKRPRRALPLAGRIADAIIPASRIRFDLYLNTSIRPCRV
ncbi:MAG: rRNA methyltransferase [Nevskiaceae bacterium]|nr:MAG: rRNA methyltransferase [Nevskiaceae bacterium]TBR74817.1 MAG: rRNA methyltransferase [Nevskiaceae bacterium]